MLIACYSDAVRFWMITITRYMIAAFVALFISLLLSVVSVLPWAEDDSPGFVIIWFLVFVAETSLIVPVGLGITAEQVQRKVLGRRFQWSCASRRTLVALPIAVGPVYAAVWVMPYVESRRPAHWIEKGIFFFCVSGVFAYIALRIHKQASSATG